MPSRFRKKRYALLAILLGVYGFVFCLVVFGTDRDGRFGVSRSADAQAEDISCSRNWFVLGATWSCRATVVAPDGQRVPYSSFASALTPDDIGQRVEMSKIRVKGQGTQFVPARSRPAFTAGVLVGAFGFGSLALFGPIVLWPRKPNQAPVPMLAGEKLERARKLRQRSLILLGVGFVALYGGYVAFGFLMAAKANTDRATHQEVKGTGVATGCARDWSYLGQLWSCDVTVTMTNPGVTILSPTGASPFTTTVRYSQFTPDDVDRPVPMTATSTANPFADAFEWTPAEKPRESPIARWVFIGLPLAGLVCIVIALDSRKRARRDEREASADSAALNT